MKYRRKSEIIETVKWDGNIETINNNKWLEDAIKDNKIILGMDDIYDKNPILLIANENIVKIKKEDYIIRETFNQNYKIRVMDCETFENLFEALEEKEELNNLENEFMKVKKMRETRKIFINNEKCTNSFKVVTKDIFISQHIEETYQIGEVIWQKS